MKTLRSKTLKSAAVLFTTLLGFALTSQVEAKSLGKLSDGDTSYLWGVAKKNKSFNDTYNFKLDSLYDLTGEVFYAGISSLQIALDGVVATLTDTVTCSFFGLSGYCSDYSFSGVAAGKHKLEISGLGGGLGGGYLGDLNVAAVPEADTWLMIVIGLGLVGYQLRRKHKSLQQHRPVSLPA